MTRAAGGGPGRLGGGPGRLGGSLRRVWLAAWLSGLLLLAACTPSPTGSGDGAVSPATTPPSASSSPSVPSSTSASAGSAAPSSAAASSPSAVPDPSTLTGTRDWRLTRPAGRGQIEGFATQAGADPGVDLSLKVSTTASRYRVVAYRIGSYRGGDGAEVWRSKSLVGQRQPGPRMVDRVRRTVVAPWRTSVTTATDDWPPGFYLLVLRTGRGLESSVPYVVTSPDTAGTVALVAPVATWQAYNDWGGYSLYRGPDGQLRASAVSFDRPYPAPGAGLAGYGAMPVVIHAERLGIALSYLTNLDLETDPAALEGARGYVSMGHDEYWTNQMRATVTAARDAGTNLAFLGANTMYWRVRLENDSAGTPRTVVGYRDRARRHDPMMRIDPKRATTQFRQRPDPEPENSLTGMKYECFPVDAPFRVVSPDWWGFARTGVRQGSRFPRLVGIEADRVYPVASTPRPLQILADTSYPCLQRPTSAQTVYYTVDSGAGVFNAGTLRWTCALVNPCGPARLSARTQRFVRTVTSTLLRAYVGGPVGAAHPAQDNIGRFDLPRRNHVPAT